MAKAGQGEVDIVPVMGGFRSTVDSQVDAAGKSSSNRFASAFGNGIKGLGAFVGKSLAVAGGLTAAVAAIAIKGGISRQLQIEDATAKMTGLGNSTSTVKQTMDNALSAVKGTAFGMGEAATVASTALASGIKPGQQMSKYLTLVADAATIAGTGMGEMGQIMGKVTNSGKVTNDVLNQFGDRGVGVLQMLAKHYGVTAEEMTSMVSKGKVDAETFNKVLTENVGGAAQKSGDTTKGAFANMGAALSRVGVTLSSGFFPLFKSVFNQVTKTLDGMNDKIKPAAEAFGTWFQGKAGPAIAGFSTVALAAFDKVYTRVLSFALGFQRGMNDVEVSRPVGVVQRFGIIVGGVFKELRGGIIAFGAAWAANDGDITSSGFPGFMERVANATRPLVDAFKALDFSSFSAFTASLSAAGGTAGKSLGSIGDSIKTLAPAFKEFGAQLPNIGGALVKLGGVSLNILTFSLGFLAKHVDTIIKFMPAIVAGYVAWRVASSAMAGAALKINAAQVAAVPLTTVNNVLRLIAIRQENQLAIATGSRTVAMQASLAAMAREKVALAAKSVAMVAGKVAMGAAIAAQWAWNAAVSANPIGLVIIAIVALIAGIILLVKNWGAVTGFLQTVWQGFVSWFQAVMAGFLGWWDGIWQGFLGVVAPVWTAIQQVIQTVWQVIVTVVTTYIGMVLTVIQAVWAVIQVVFSTAWEIIQTIVATALAILIAVFTGNFDKIGGYIASAWEKIKGYFTAAFVAIGSIVSGAWSTLTGLFTGAVDRIKSLLSGGWNSMRDTAMAVWNAIVAWIAGIPGRVLAGIVGLALLHIQVGQWIASVKDAAVAKFLELVSWVTGLPGRVLGALGNMGSLLWDAGNNIIQGFLNGLTAGFESVKNFVGGIGDWIKDHKGPEAYDKALLIPAGGWIIGGLTKSLKAGIPALKGTLGAVSATIRAGVNAPTLPDLTTTVRSSPTTGKAASPAPNVQITNYYPQAEPNSKSTERASSVLSMAGVL